MNILILAISGAIAAIVGSLVQAMIHKMVS